jgi:hypothetical protein
MSMTLKDDSNTLHPDTHNLITRMTNHSTSFTSRYYPFIHKAFYYLLDPKDSCLFHSFSNHDTAESSLLAGSSRHFEVAQYPQHVRNYSPNDKASHLRRLGTLATSHLTSIIINALNKLSLITKELSNKQGVISGSHDQYGSYSFLSQKEVQKLQKYSAAPLFITHTHLLK